MHLVWWCLLWGSIFFLSQSRPDTHLIITRREKICVGKKKKRTVKFFFPECCWAYSIHPLLFCWSGKCIWAYHCFQHTHTKRRRISFFFYKYKKKGIYIELLMVFGGKLTGYVKNARRVFHLFWMKKKKKKKSGGIWIYQKGGERERRVA